MLPIPSINYIPKVFRDKGDSTTIALTDKMDEHILDWFEDIINLENLVDAEKCPAGYLGHLGYLVNAGILEGDTETSRRKKILGAIASHKRRGSWEYHAKILIDAITGCDARIFKISDSDDWILCGDGFTETGTSWAILEGGVDDPYGFSLIGEGDEIEFWGNIYIDCHYGVYTPVLTTDQITMIVESIATDVVPAYVKVYLGYMTGAGVGFTTYAGGTIS